MVAVDWEQFRADPVLDSPGVRLEKLYRFMHAFIDAMRDET